MRTRRLVWYGYDGEGRCGTMQLFKLDSNATPKGTATTISTMPNIAVNSKFFNDCHSTAMRYSLVQLDVMQMPKFTIGNVIEVTANDLVAGSACNIYMHMFTTQNGRFGNNQKLHFAVDNDIGDMVMRVKVTNVKLKSLEQNSYNISGPGLTVSANGGNPQEFVRCYSYWILFADTHYVVDEPAISDKYPLAVVSVTGRQQWHPPHLPRRATTRTTTMSSSGPISFPLPSYAQRSINLELTANQRKVARRIETEHRITSLITTGSAKLPGSEGLRGVFPQ